ncbi:MAG: type II toxin-antitoxin system HicB family antitoxin [Candidatus Shapirobacteria bacterium]
MLKVLEYNTIFQKEGDGGYSVWVPSLPGCASQGNTFEEAFKNIKEAIELYLDGAEKKYSEEASAVINNQFLVPVSVSAAYA